jgi:radical SAM superfamily enzyme YgiQ (UPF0313 family)
VRRTAEAIVDELKTLDEYLVVRFADANTAVDIAELEHLFDRIEQEGIRKEFIMDIRADTAAANPRLIERLARGGLKVVICGFESFRQEELFRYRKQSDVRNIDEAVRIFHENGIMVRGNYVIPPDYGAEDFAALAEYASTRAVTYAGYTILTPMPGTSFYRESRDMIVDHDLAKYNFFNCVLRSRLPAEEFHRRVASLWTIKKGLEVI